MRGSNRRRALTVAAAVTSLQTTLVLLSARAFAAPSPKPTEGACDLLTGKAKELCEHRSTGGGSGSTPDPGGSLDNNPLDPLTSLAQGCAKAASWIITKLSD